MAQGEDAKPKHSMFPDSWVIGPAAAALAKDGDGVLIDERAIAEQAELEALRAKRRAELADATPTASAPLPAESAPGSTGDTAAEPVSPVPGEPVDSAAADVRAVVAGGAAAEPLRVAEMAARLARGDAVYAKASPGAVDTPAPDRMLTREQELAELRAENERLRRQIEESRRHRPPRRVDTPATAAAVQPADSVSLPLDEEPRRAGKVPGGRRAWGRAATLLLFLVVTAALGVSWLGAQRLAELDGPLPQRVDTLRAELAGGDDAPTLDRVVNWLVVTAHNAAGYAGTLAGQATETWNSLTAKPASESAPAEPAPPSGGE